MTTRAQARPGSRWNRSIARSTEPADGAAHSRSAIGVDPGRCSCRFRVAQRALEAGNPAPGAHGNRASAVEQDRGRRATTARLLQPAARAGPSRARRTAANRALETAPGRATDDDVAAADELRRLCLFEDDAADPEQRRHDRRRRGRIRRRARRSGSGATAATARQARRSPRRTPRRSARRACGSGGAPAPRPPDRG